LRCKRKKIEYEEGRYQISWKTKDEDEVKESRRWKRDQFNEDFSFRGEHEGIILICNV
jgi:hypothetical protein